MRLLLECTFERMQIQTPASSKQRPIVKFFLSPFVPLSSPSPTHGRRLSRRRWLQAGVFWALQSLLLPELLQVLPVDEKKKRGEVEQIVYLTEERTICRL